MKWSRYHWLSKQWAHSLLIWRRLRLEKKSHRIWLLGQPHILNQLLSSQADATWLFITFMGKEILRNALTFTTRKRNKLDDDLVMESKVIHDIETNIRMLWDLSMLLPVDQCQRKKGLTSATDEWIHALMRHKVLGVERSIAPMVGWMTPRQRHALKDYIEPIVHGVLNSRS